MICAAHAMNKNILFLLIVFCLIYALLLLDTTTILIRDENFMFSDPNQELLFHYVMPNPAVDLTFLGYLSILSIHKYHSNYIIYYHSDSKMSGYWYEQLSDEIKGKIILCSLPSEITSKIYYELDTGKIVTNPPIIADLIRLHVLYKYGGFYLDWDVIITYNLFDFTKYNFVIGSEIISPGSLNHIEHIFNSIYQVHTLKQGIIGLNGLANSFIYTKKENNFIKKWLEGSSEISSVYDYYGCKYPLKLYNSMSKPELNYIHILNPTDYYEASNIPINSDLNTTYAVHFSGANRIYKNLFAYKMIQNGLISKDKKIVIQNILKGLENTRYSIINKIADKMNLV
jgi:hypothetical protein